MQNEPKAVVQRFLADGWDRANRRWDLEVIAECFDVDRYYSHTWHGNLAETGKRQGTFFSGFAGEREMISEALVAEGDLVVHGSSWRGPHSGPLLGVPGSGRVVEVNHVEMWRVEAGKIVEHWGGIGEAASLYDQITAADDQ